jgi:uncharacterized protein YegL
MYSEALIVASSSAMKCTVNRSYVKANAGGVVFVAIDFTPPQVATVYRQNMNVSLAVDCSGSMSGGKLTRAKESALALSQQLSPNDIISVVSFESHAKVKLKATKAYDSTAIQGAIEKIELGGGTNMYGGLEHSYKETLKNSGNAGTISRVLLLTDGQPTEGKTNDNDFVKLAQKIRDDGITITTLGIGNDYNDALLTKIAQTGGGLWYHIRDPSRDLGEIFKEQVTQMIGTLVRNPVLKMRLMPGAEFSQAFAVKPMLTQLPNPIGADNQYQIPIKDLISGQEQNLVFKIRFPSRQPGLFRLLRAELQNNSQDLTVTYTIDPKLYEPELDPYPRALLRLSEATVVMRNGIASNDQTVARNADTILREITADGNLATVVKKNPVVGDVLTALQGTKLKMSKGPISESDKKQMMQESTFIGKKKTDMRS